MGIAARPAKFLPGAANVKITLGVDQQTRPPQKEAAAVSPARPRTKPGAASQRAAF